ncbi:MAG: LysM peptidoglycan-binding domain-containing protein [Alphaproteobacteria bacterium]|nr:LysM peptidoglycan-binding domain-containing protein [Alphaproteobacteria bacterium]
MKKNILLMSVMGALFLAGTASAAQHTVQSGEWLSKIAAKYKVTVAQIADWNPQIKDVNLIYPGQIIAIGEVDESLVAAARARGESVKPYETKVEEKKAAVKEAEPKKACAACDNVINGNPMYRPGEGRFYSVTTLGTDTKFEDWGLNEQFGFGITNRLSVFLSTDLTTHKFESDFTKWDNLGLGLSFRYLDMKHWKADAYGSLTAIRTTMDWWDSDTNFYNWRAGTKIGYTTCEWTVNGLFEYDYFNSGAFNWNEVGYRTYRAGVEGQYVFNADWNIVARATYEMPEYVDNFFTGRLGVNYNFSPKAYLGAYVFQTLTDGELADDTGLALQFGIDF